MNIVLLGPPEQGKALRHRRYLKHIRYNIYLQAIFSEKKPQKAAAAWVKAG